MSEDNQKNQEENLNFNEITSKPNITPSELNFPEQEMLNSDDGVEVIKDQVEENEDSTEISEEVITDKNLRKLVEFTTGVKDLTQEELDSLRDDEKELERLIRISSIKASHFNYNPKKHFGVKYRKARQKRRKLTRQSRVANRR